MAQTTDQTKANGHSSKGLGACGTPPPVRKRNDTPFRQALAIQHSIFKQTQSEETTGAALAQLARAFVDLEQLKREIRMKPKPKPVDVNKIAKPKPTAMAHLEDGPADAPEPPGDTAT